MEEGTEPQEEVMTEVMDQHVEHEAPDVEADQDNDSDAQQHQEEKHVPLSALQKERRKRQELEARANRAEIEAQYLREMQRKQEPVEEDESQYESVTRADLKQTSSRQQEEILRQVEERIWIKANLEKKQYVDENLESFLQKKPNLRTAIAESSNRYEEAYTLMEALTPRERRQMAQPVQRKATPGSPTAVPKAAAMNQAIDVMSMNDDEYRQWRQAQRKRR